ncbi:hypothetical protein FHR83_006471 [Actinoplanes campanulatus]|uniref:FIMAH domain-containing protein n=1 Tax=Actinoplanes campanulatus TaxID=113559 RepID=A0A7W5FHS5_9ACTN|nr:hypothetical protein [Actinoplanes campanulatus]MBB3098772.1 hypothetical protein [Actinoplanes campanulatus]GGN37106.1 hypothetical protein GCM10010109_62740 [Actinoplanes campanulatus]GID40725.1 hypothetical protein Aca09nite_72310 [Actinoplanes campanulatus]
MPDPHDLYQPTAPMPVVEQQRGVYRAADHRRVALLAAAGSAVVLAALAVWLFSGDDDTPPPVAAPPAVVVTSAAPVETPEPSLAETEAATTTVPVTVRPAQPAELIAALRAVVDSLEDQGEIDDDGAEALDRRLKSAADRLERGKAKDAARKMDEFAEKLVDLREDDDISQSAFNALASGATQVRAALPAR